MLREACRRKAKLSQGIWSDDTTEGHAKVLGDSPVDGGCRPANAFRRGGLRLGEGVPENRQAGTLLEATYRSQRLVDAADADRGPGSADRTLELRTISITTPGTTQLRQAILVMRNLCGGSGVAFPLQVLTNPATLQLVPLPSSLTFAAGVTKGNSVTVTYTSINGFHGSYQFQTSFAPNLGSPAPGTPATVSLTGSYDVNGNYIEVITINSTAPHLSSINGSGPGMTAGKHSLVAWACLLLLIPFTRQRYSSRRIFVLVLGLASFSTLTACSGGTSPSQSQPVQQENCTVKPSNHQGFIRRCSALSSGFVWCQGSLRRVVGEAEAGELPAGGGGEEVAVGGADVGGGGDAGASAEDHLRGHELAVVLAEGSGEGFVAGVAGVAAGGPLPDVAEDLLEAGVRVDGGAGRGDWLRGDGRACCGSSSSSVGSLRRMLSGGGVLPLELGGEAVAGPAGVGVGLEEAEVADGGFAEVFERTASRGGCRCTSRIWWRCRAASRAGPASLRRAWWSSLRRARARGGCSRSRP